MFTFIIRNTGTRISSRKYATWNIFGGKTPKDYSTEASFQVKACKLHRLDSGPSTSVKCSRDDALTIYKHMFAIRRLETAANQLYKEKFVRGFCHLYSGQEAVAVGIESSLRKDDAVITAYRAHGWTYLRGVNIKGVLTELTGRRTGCAKGKGGSMHMYNDNFFGGNGIVGAQVPLGAGIAMAQKYMGTDNVTVALYGDGAANQGQMFEAYNMSKLWNLPCIFVCENNGYGMGTSAERSSASTEYYTRGDYVPGIWVDGMDVLAVREAARFAVEQCRQGKGPFLMEMATYRYHGHSMSDPGTSYRTREEVQEVRQKQDPITSFKDKIISNKLGTAEELKVIEQAIQKEVNEATVAAKNEPEIGLEELFADVYVEPIVKQIRGVTPFQYGEHKRIRKPRNV